MESPGPYIGNESLLILDRRYVKFRSSLWEKNTENVNSYNVFRILSRKYLPDDVNLSTNENR